MTTLASTPASGSYTLSPLLQPAPTPDPPQILALQTPPTAPQNNQLEVGTNLLNITPSMEYRLRNFPEEIYTLNPTDHLVRLIKVLIGDAGAGQLNKRMTMARMGTIIQGANFYDLDAFYGALFRALRRSDEQLPINPYTDTATADTWSTIRSLDASYRARIDQLGKAISFGPSAIGMELIAEAILQIPCSVYEGWVVSDLDTRTWGSLEAYTWLGLQGLGSWGNLESTSGAASNTNRKTFTIVPHRAITQEEAFDLRRVVNVLKPADTILNINTTGVDAQLPISITGVYADSSYWELTESVIPNPNFSSLYDLSPSIQPGGWQELLKPAFTEYQGEQISYGGDITGVSAFDENADGTMLTTSVVDAYTFQDGITLYYPPTQAIATRFYSLGARYVSDGILQAAPYSTDTQNVPTSSTSTTPPLDLYVDGVPIYDVLAALESPGANTVLGINPSDQRFWSTPPRPATDDTTEVLTVQLIAPRLVNNLTFEVAHFPQMVQVQTFDLTTATWNTIFSQSIYDSIPASVSPIVPIAHEHPQHTGSGCWIPYTLSIPPTTMSQVRILLQRITKGTPPIGIQTVASPRVGGGNQNVLVPIPYSLGVRNFALGYQVAQESDLPTQPIVTQDALGSQVQFNVRQEMPGNTIDGSPIPWRCEPQPTADSVVNFYLDVRGDSAVAQQVDKIFMDPVYLGPHCSVYYSNDDITTLGFEAEGTNLLPPIVESTGLVSTTSTGLVFDTLNNAYVDIDNNNIQFDPSAPWWCGFEITPTFASSDLNPTIFDFGNGLNLTLHPMGIILNGGGATATVSNVTFPPGKAITIIVAYFPETTDQFAAGLYVFSASNSATASQETLIQGGDVQPIVHPIFDSLFLTGGFSAFVLPGDMGFPQSDLRIGARLSSPTPGGFTLNGLCLKQATLTYEDLNRFTTDEGTYTQIDGSNTANALVRWDPGNVTTVNVLGFVGGPGNFWGLLNWTPIMRDYVLAKGYMNIPPTAAKYFKLEFTNLVAQPMPTLIPITKTVNTMSGLPGGSVQTAETPLLNSPGPSPVGTSDAISFASTVFFNDSPLLTTPLTAPLNPNTPQPTMIQSAPDLNTQTTLASSGWQWQYQPWATSVDAPRFVYKGLHNYNSSTISQSTQVSYFVGLNSIGVFRSNFDEGDDSKVYEEIFWDNTFIEATDIPQNPGDVNTVGISSFPVTATSAIYSSTNNIVGVQFATIQSDAIEIAYDDDFQYAGLAPPYAWNNVNDAHVVGDATAVWQQATSSVLITVNNVAPIVSPGKGYEGLDEPIVYPIFEGNVPAGSSQKVQTPFIGTASSLPGTVIPGYLDVPTGSQPSQAGYGGLENAYAPTGPSGTLYAAVRLTTNENLDGPLSLELINVATGGILNSKEITCSPGQIVEEYVGYTFSGSLEAVCSRIVQYGSANNSWTVERLSTFEEGWIWEFSNNGGQTWVNSLNIRNDAYGVVSFPTTGNQLQWRLIGNLPNLHVNYLRIRPIYSGFTADEPLGIIQGPNVSVYDHTPPIDEDPFFSGFYTAVPYWWYLVANEYPILGVIGVPVATQYSQFYIRTTSDTVSTSDGASYKLNPGRLVHDTITVSDVVTRRVVLNRHTTDTMNVSDNLVNTGSATWGALQAHTWGSLQAYTWGQLQTLD